MPSLQIYAGFIVGTRCFASEKLFENRKNLMMTNDTILQNDHLRLEFRMDGSLQGVINQKTGRNFIEHPDEGHLFRLLLPLDDWDGHHLDNRDQAVEIQFPEGESDPAMLLIYPALDSARGRFDIRVECLIKLEDDQALLKFTVRNNSRHLLTECWFPWLGGLRALTPNPQDTHLLVPGFFHGQDIPAPYDQLDSSNAWLTNAPGGGRKVWLYPRNMQWADYYNADEGLYFAMHDEEIRAKAFMIQRKNHAAPDFEMCWIHYAYLQPGETFESPEYILAPHEGDWHWGADIYRGWLYSWMTPRDTPSYIKESIGWHFAFVRLGDGATVRTYEDLPSLYEEATAAGLDALQIFGFHESGMDRGYPDYAPIAAYGGGEGLKTAIQRIRDQGGRVALYQAGSAVNLLCERFRAEIDEWAVRSGRGDIFRLDWNWNVYDTNWWRRSEPFVLLCYASGWRGFLVEESKRYINDYGASAVHFDHIGDFEFYLCHSDAHRHDKPATAPAEISDLFREIRQSIDAIDPEAAIHCEGLSELSAPWVDVHWGQNSLAGLPDVIRYTLPDLLYTTLIQENDTLNAARAFVYGILMDVCIELGTGSIASYPEFGAYIAQLAALRKELAEFLVYGTFKDVCGIEIEEGILAKVFVSEAGIGVPVLNLTEEQRTCNLKMDTALLDIGGEVSARVYNLDGTQVEAVLPVVRLDLDPGELRVVVVDSRTR